MGRGARHHCELIYQSDVASIMSVYLTVNVRYRYVCGCIW